MQRYSGRVTGYGVAPILSEHSEPGRRSAEALNIPRLPPQCSRHDPKQIEIPKQRNRNPLHLVDRQHDGPFYLHRREEVRQPAKQYEPERLGEGDRSICLGVSWKRLERSGKMVPSVAAIIP